MDIGVWRLRAQCLAGEPLPDPASVVGRLGAVQAQDYPMAKWAVALRCGAADADLDAALAAGTIVRTHVMRPTWHFVHPADLRWIMRLTAGRVRAASRGINRRLGLDDAAFTRANTLLERALAGGGTMTRAEIAGMLVDRGLPADGTRLAHILMRAELDLVVCSAGLRGRQHTYGLVDERVPADPGPSGEAALGELALRYFSSHGPATARDFAWWSGLTLTDARRGLALAGAALETATLGERTYAFAPDTPGALADPPVAHLLQVYDEFIVAYGESRDAADATGVVSRLVDRVHPHGVVIDGTVVGAWRREPRGRELAVRAQLPAALDASARRALDAELARLGAFTGRAASWG